MLPVTPPGWWHADDSLLNISASVSSRAWPLWPSPPLGWRRVDSGGGGGKGPGTVTSPSPTVRRFSVAT